MSRDISIQYRSPQQLPQSRKPNMENCPPQRNTNEFIKQMKKRNDQPPLSIVSGNSQIQDAKSIFIDVSRIEQHSSNSNNSFIDNLRQPILPQCHRSNQPSNCTTQRTNRYEMPRNSKPYLDQTDNMGMLLIQQQMLQLQNENILLKQQLEKQESQRLLFQQQLLQQFQNQQQQQQQPIVINNNITPQEKKQPKIIQLDQEKEESYSPPKKIVRKKQLSQAIQTDKSQQEQQSFWNDSFQTEQQQVGKFDSVQSQKFTGQDQSQKFTSQDQSFKKQLIQSKKQTQDTFQNMCTQNTKQSMESLTFGTQISQRNVKIQQDQSDKNIQIKNNQTDKDINISQSNYSQLVKNSQQTRDDSYLKNDNSNRKYSQFDINEKQEKVQNDYYPESRKHSQPNLIPSSVKMEFNFENSDKKEQKSLADYFSQRKKTTMHERKVSTQMPIQEEDESWIVNVKQRSKEEQIKLRKEMMEYGRSRRQQTQAAKSQTPNNQESDKKEQIKRVQSPLMERLAQGQKAKVEEKEMFALTKKNYENLPEVKNKKNQEEMKIQKQQFMKERQNKLKELDDKIKEKLKKPQQL